MATDNSPPRNGLILLIAVASVLTLGALKFVFDSYYRYVMEDEVAAKLAQSPPTELRAARIEDQQRLASGPMPIDRAIKDLARNREAPQQSADDGPMLGWSKAPRPLVAPTTATAIPDGGAAVNAAVDAGAAIPAHPVGVAARADAGATRPMTPADAGRGKLQGPTSGPSVSDAGGNKP